MMRKEERDQVMMHMTQEQRAEFRRIVSELRAAMKATPGRHVTVTELLDAQRVDVPPSLHAVVRRMEAIYHRFRTQVAFFVVYVQEAHPTDGRQVDSNVQEGILYRQHQTFDEREAVAQACSLDLYLPLPILVEEIDNVIDEAYGAAPERLYVIGADGRVAYQGGAGPHFFDLDEWEQAIETCVKTGRHADTKPG